MFRRLLAIRKPKIYTVAVISIRQTRDAGAVINKPTAHRNAGRVSALGRVCETRTYKFSPGITLDLQDLRHCHSAAFCHGFACLFCGEMEVITTDASVTLRR